MKRIIISALAALFSIVAFGEATIKVQAPNLVSSDEQFNLTFIIEGEHSPSSFDWTCPSNFKVVWGPQKGTSTSISIINGKKSTSSQTTYTYVLMPLSAGTFTIPSATATIKSETVSSRTVQIEVVDSGSQNQASASAQTPDRSSEASSSSSSTVAGSNLYMKLILSKNKAVVGETITAVLKLYQRVTIAGFEDAKFPNFNGFWSQELQSPSNIEFRRENVGGEIYNTAVLRSWNLIPQQAGEIRIEPSELVCLVNVRAPRTSTGSIFDSFFQDDYQTIRKRITTPALTVNVSKLPAGAPASFTGAVGKYSMSAALTRDSLRAHDAASLKVTVTGTGNIALLEAPKINFPPDFEVYDTKVSEVSSGKMFEYPFIPRSHGTFDLGSVEFSYYDVAQGKYVTIHSDPLHINVSRGADGGSFGTQSVAAPTGQKDVRNLGSDIRYITAKAPDFKFGKRLFVGSALFWIISLLLLIASAAYYFIRRKVVARRSDVVLTKSRGAMKMARKRLSRAGEFLAGDLYSAFYEELHKTLLGYVSDRLNIDMSDMSKENIAARLSSAGVPGTVASDFTGLLDACEFARYSPSSGHEAMSNHYEAAVSTVAAIEESMKKKVNKSSGTALLAVALLCAVSWNAGAADLDSLWNSAVSAYEKGMWADAQASFEAISSEGCESAELQYNIGCAAFKNREYAKAVLGFERALKLDPSHKDAAFNLEFVRSRIQDKVEVVPEFFLKTFFRKVRRIFIPDVWAVIFLVLLAAGLALGLLFLLGNGRARKAGFFSSIVVLAFALFVLLFAFSGKEDFESREMAVVVSAVSSVKSAPGESSIDLFVLHEGTKVKILDSARGWMDVELSDGRQGWMVEGDLEII